MAPSPSQQHSFRIKRKERKGSFEGVLKRGKPYRPCWMRGCYFYQRVCVYPKSQNSWDATWSWKSRVSRISKHSGCLNRVPRPRQVLICSVWSKCVWYIYILPSHCQISMNYRLNYPTISTESCGSLLKHDCWMSFFSVRWEILCRFAHS